MAIIRAKNVVTLLVIGIGLLVTLSACENSKYAEVISAEDLWADGQTATVPDTGTQTERQAQSAQSDQTGGSFEEQSIDEELLDLSEPLVVAPEPPPGPASPAGDASESARDSPESGPEAALSVPARVLPEGYSHTPRVERSPASDYVPDSPPQVFRDARVREFRVSSVDRPTKEIARAEASAPKTALVGDRTMPPEGPVAEPEAAPMSEKPVPATEPVAEPEMEIAKLEPSDFVSEAPVPALEASRVETRVASELADVFFDFDQYAIQSRAIPVLEKNAELLKQTYQASSVLIEGHCDERGTGEYNLELGKRRAQALKEYLVNLGIEESRIQIASYGKEKPFCTESTPSCWQNNRRGHFVQRVLRISLSK